MALHSMRTKGRQLSLHKSELGAVLALDRRKYSVEREAGCDTVPQEQQRRGVARSISPIHSSRGADVEGGRWNQGREI